MKLNGSVRVVFEFNYGDREDAEPFSEDAALRQAEVHIHDVVEQEPNVLDCAAVEVQDENGNWHAVRAE